MCYGQPDWAHYVTYSYYINSYYLYFCKFRSVVLHTFPPYLPIETAAQTPIGLNAPAPTTFGIPVPNFGGFAFSTFGMLLSDATFVKLSVIYSCVQCSCLEMADVL